MCLEKFRTSKFLKGSLSFTICPINSLYEKLGVMEYFKSLNFNQHSYWNAHFLIVLELVVVWKQSYLMHARQKKYFNHLFQFTIVNIFKNLHLYIPWNNNKNREKWFLQFHYAPLYINALVLVEYICLTILNASSIYFCICFCLVVAIMSQVSLKLLVNTETNQVLFAEAGKDFVDILCGFLTLPLGT